MREEGRGPGSQSPEGGQAREMEEKEKTKNIRKMVDPSQGQPRHRKKSNTGMKKARRKREGKKEEIDRSPVPKKRTVSQPPQ